MRPRDRRRAIACALLAGMLGGMPAAFAQLRLPQLPQLPGVPIDPLRRADPLGVVGRAANDLQGERRRRIGELLRRNPDRVEADPAGEPVLRGELVLLAPGEAVLGAARSQGLRVLREAELDGLGLHVVVLRVPAGLGTAEALARLRAVDPALQADFNHLYLDSGEVAAAPPKAGAENMPPAAAPPDAAVRIGLVDGGIDRRHPALQSAAMQLWGCGGTAQASAHGTAIASLLVGQAAPFRGAVPGAALFAADVYCGDAAGGSAETLAQALAWMARERVPVVNVSLVGPANRLTEQVVAAMVARGHLLVAAVGNDGPAAPPLYPAAYPGVVGVTAVNAARRVLPEAARGPHVAFAAPGADIAVAVSGERGYTTARGTSFAAPLVAALLTATSKTGLPDADGRAVEALARTAIDLGPAGRDPTYGWGLVGEALRIDPQRVAASDRLLH